MNHLKITIIGIFTCFLVTISMATEKENDLMATQVKFFKSNIGEQIVYPADAKEAMIEGTVATSIKILGNGKLQITGINGHPLLAASVKHQLETIILQNNSILSGEEVLMKIKFNIE